jgi:branched-chain amino acid transport system permease protein
MLRRSSPRRYFRVHGSRSRPAAERGRQPVRVGALRRSYRIAVGTAASRALLVAGLVLLAGLIALPAFAARSLLQDLFFLFTMAALAQYWNLLAGYAGLVSVGQQAFVGIGGYALFALVIYGGVDPIVAVVASGAVAAVLAIPTALVTFRLRAAYFAVGTWVAAEVFRLLAAQVKALGGGTGTSLPIEATRTMLGGYLVATVLDVRPAAARDVIAYWLALLIAVVSLAAIYATLRSRRGLALAAIRDSEIAAESVGVDVWRTKFLVYVGTAFGTGTVGALIYLQKARISPDAAFSVLDWTAYVIVIVVIGGIGTIEGPLVGVLVFYLMQDYLAAFGAWYLMLLGLLAITIMMAAPGGVWGTLAERFDLHIFPTRRRLRIEE